LPGAAEDRDYLVLSTIHSAKGLEWKAVYVLHASEGMIPLERSFDDDDALKEERRMFYVALTRAADLLYVCHAEFHYQRGGYAGWNRWDDDGFRELTRFLSLRAQKCFDRQTASQFVPPDSLVARQSQSPPPRKSTRKKRKSRPVRRG
jgi:DNA helicase-2/ATP-dependent DNA helicase PcrA